MEGHVTEEPIDKVQQAFTLPSKAVIGYWHNFKNKTGCPFPLRNVASYWDVVNVSFAERDPAGDGTVAFHVYNNTVEGCSLSGLSEANFKSDITYLKGQGKIVALSLGGAEGTITLANLTNENNFVSSLTSIIQNYGFDGLDVDYEGGSGISHEGAIIKNKHLSNALKRIRTNVGGSMYLSMAPEHPYVHGGLVAYSGIWGSYLPLINDLRNELTVLHVQLYNNGAVPNPYAAQPYGTYSLTTTTGKIDNLVASIKMLVNGFQPSGGPAFAGLPASKLAFGIPSGPESSGGPLFSTTEINRAYDCITANTNCGTLTMGTSQSGFRGVMTWSINWDKYDIAQNTSSRVNFSSIDSHMGGGGGDCTPITCQTGDCGSKPNGCGGTLSCGSCSGGATCNSSYRCTTCSPQTCAGLGATCGAPSNGCGGTLSCGSCGTFFSCDSSFSCVSTLRSHWKMDAFMNGTNNVYDETGANNQIAFASTAVRPSIVTGKIGSAMQFDGVDDQGTVPSIVHSRIAGGSGASISAWLKSDGPKSGCSGTNCRQQVFYSYTSDAGGSLTMRLSENYELTCGGRPGTGTSNPWTEAKIKYTWQGVWTHAVCVLDAANDRIRIYVNGSEVTNITASWAATSVVNANIATADNVGGGASRYFKGAIDQLKLFNKVLTTSEITSLYQEAGSTCTPLTCQTGDCGSKPNGCGGTLSCGSCQTGYTCNSSNRCVSSCTPTTCQTGDCGAKPNGCGGTLSCGSCATGQSCNASYKCATTCTPTTCPTGGCGSMSDGCSGTLNCGSCPTGYSCNTSNQCVTSTGGGCTTLKAWSATEDWTVYTSDPWRKHNNRKWECHTAGWCYLEPGGANSSLGWTDRGAC